MGIPRDFIAYEGTSLLDGYSPIVALVNGYDRATQNPKIGRMLQLWILDASIPPHDAVRTGRDASVCGGCSLRGEADGEKAQGRVCYVRPYQAPLSVWRRWKAGGYARRTDPAAIAEATRGWPVRLGAYGDPAAVPLGVLEALARHASTVTGYTHAWRDGFALAELCMASCETQDDVEAATALGYRTYTAVPRGTPRPPGTMQCAYDDKPEHGAPMTCAECGACGGTSATATAHVQVWWHASARSRRHRLPVL